MKINVVERRAATIVRGECGAILSLPELMRQTLIFFMGWGGARVFRCIFDVAGGSGSSIVKNWR